MAPHTVGPIRMSAVSGKSDGLPPFSFKVETKQWPIVISPGLS